MGLGAAATAAVTGIAGAVGATAATAATIGAIGGPVLLGAGAGALTGAVTHGNILDDALLGGVTGGIGGVAGVAGPALGLSSGATEALGAGAGALGGAGVSAATGGNPLTGALAGGLGGYGGASTALSGLGASPDAAAGAPGTTALADQSSMINPDGSFVVPPVPPELSANGQVVTNASGAPVYETPAAAQEAAYDNAYGAPGASGYNAGSNTLNAQSSLAAQGSGSGSGSGSSGVTGGLSGLMNNPAVMLGAVAGLSSLLNKPQQAPYGNTPGPAQAAANLGSLYNAPLLPGGPGSTPTAPAVNYYTYGQGPEQTFFKNNSLAAYGFRKGGLAAISPGEWMTDASNSNHVRGPGGPREDKIPAMLSNGEFVLTAREVAQAGQGSNDRGAKKIERMRKTGALSQLIARSKAA